MLGKFGAASTTKNNKEKVRKKKVKNGNVVLATAVAA